MKLPETYILNKFYAYSGDPEFKKFDNTYNAGCPVCKEGKSWGSKKRLYFYPTSNTLYCFNCSKNWSALNWILEVSGLSKEEIFSEINSNTFSLDVTDKIEFKSKKIKTQSPSLPYDSINLFDETQKNYYINNKSFLAAYQYIEKRKLKYAVNRPSCLYLSLTDFVHKNRICIPFQDRNKKIIFYQSRCVNNTNPKYLGKYGSDKSLFGIDRVDPDLEYIFIFEGPIDAMFVKNGVAAAGLTLNTLQKQQLSEFPFHKKIWVLDNPLFDDTAKNKIKELINNGELVFMWQSNMRSKDFNEYAVSKNINEIDYNIIINNTFGLAC